VTDRKAYLKEALTAINRKLPASVYIPFVNNSIRNYAVLYIVVDEAKVFQTKERAPLLLCIEAYRPEELQLVKEEKRRSQNNYLQNTGEILPADYENYRSNSWHSSNTTQKEPAG
jgi:hypothetical protein